MVVESTIALRNKLHAILSGNGYKVNTFKVSADALEELEASKTSPYFLIISSYMMPKMKGDELLKRAREIAPDTQRILIADASELQTMVSAINLAGIHSCLTLPFNDEDVIKRVTYCRREYETNRKQKHLKILTQRQNKQLFQIAGNFKKEEALCAAQIEQKNKEIRILESRIQSAGGSVYADKPVLLKDILAKHNVSFSPDSFGKAFLEMKDQIRQMFETAVSSHSIALKSVSYRESFNKTPSTHEHKGLVETLLPMAFILFKKNKISTAQSSIDPVKEITLDNHFELTVSKSGTKAFLKLKTTDTRSLAISHVKQFLEKNKIINGVKEEHVIESWLYKATPEDEPFIIAQTKDPKYPKNAEVRYHFPTDFLHAGKVNEDGSINFQDRGEIPFVEENAFLAAKIFPEQGSPGIDVFGNEILVDEPVDIAFSSGPGTRLSEDGVKIYAATAGQPHLDAMGNVSVCPEFQLKGDLGFETGNVNFDGNVIVNGAVKPGFKIQCASLTAQEIQGAEIDITGDLNVSLGIVDTELVNVKGSVQAKFIHNSKINAFGDLIVQKEIIDSKIHLSGACINETGLILNSEISAKMGIRAGSIGNKSSKPSTLTVGVDEHTNLLVAKVDSALGINNSTLNELTAEISELEKEDQGLHAVISKHAYVQDRAQLELKDIEKKMADLKASGNMAAYQKVLTTIKKIRMDAKEAEEKINSGFNRQDEIALEISQKKSRIKEFEGANKTLLDEKKRLLEFSNRKNPLPEVTVAKKIEAGTQIFAANSSRTLYESSSRCKIKEFARSSEGSGGILFHELQVTNF